MKLIIFILIVLIIAALLIRIILRMRIFMKGDHSITSIEIG